MILSEQQTQHLINTTPPYNAPHAFSEYELDQTQLQ